MAKVVMTANAINELLEIPLVIQARVRDIIIRLERWPAVSGAKPLRGILKGSFRIKTGAYRVIFTVSIDGQAISITKIGYRGGVYD